MFSQFTTFASKITAELSLDNLQREQDHDQDQLQEQHQEKQEKHENNKPQQSSPPSLPSQPSPGSLPSSSSLSSSIPSVPIPPHPPVNPSNDWNQDLLHEKDLQIQFLTKTSQSLKEELFQLKVFYEKKEKYERNEREKGEKEKRNILQDFHLLQTKHHDLELEFCDLQKLYQSRYQHEQQQQQQQEQQQQEDWVLQHRKTIEEGSSSQVLVPCESCISYQSQIETIEKDFQLQIENLNKKNSKLQKQNKKFEKELQEAQAQIQILTQTAAALLPQDVNSTSERDMNRVQSSENVNPSQSLLEEEIRKNSLKENEIQSLSHQLEATQREYQELKEKQQTQTTKMKEKVKEFIESQRLLQIENTNLTKALNGKDADIEQLESKLKSLESNLNQRKDLSSELAERYSDAQRELTKRNIEINRLRETVETLEKTLQDSQGRISAREEELTNLTQSYQNLMKSFDDFKLQSQESQRVEEKRSSSQLSEAMNEMNQKIHALQSELQQKQQILIATESQSQELREELEQVKIANQSFEEYKLRAQKTLKQANATNTSLNSKLTSLENEIETKTEIIEKLTEDIKLSKIEIDRLQNEITELKTQDHDLTDHENELSESRNVLKTVTAERDQYKRELDLYLKRTEESKNSLSLNERGEGLKYEHSRGILTPDIVVLGSGSDEDLQLKSDEDGLGVILTGGSKAFSRSHLPPISSSEAPSGESSHLTLPDHSSDLYVIYQVILIYFSVPNPFLPRQLRDTINRLHQELADRHNEIEELKSLLQQERDNKLKVTQKLDELNAFHERTKKLLNSPESAINIEYLKRCVYRLMVTKELTEKRSLYPVISVLLKFTPQEAASVAKSIEEDLAVASGDGSWSRISNSIGSLFANT